METEGRGASKRKLAQGPSAEGSVTRLVRRIRNVSSYVATVVACIVCMGRALAKNGSRGGAGHAKERERERERGREREREREREQGEEGGKKQEKASASEQEKNDYICIYVYIYIYIYI